MCQTTGERLPAAWIISRIRIAAAAPLVLVRRGEGSGSALVCVCVCVSLAKTRDLIANHPLKEIALYGSPFGTFFLFCFPSLGVGGVAFFGSTVHSIAQLRASLDETR